MSTQSMETPSRDVQFVPLRPPTHERQRPSGSEKHVRRLLKFADVEIGGGRPWDILVHNPRVYRRVIADGSLGLGEAYMDGDWSARRWINSSIGSSALGLGNGLGLPFHFSCNCCELAFKIAKTNDGPRWWLMSTMIYPSTFLRRHLMVG